MWLFADQASFPSAADNHGRVVHNHADGAIFYAHGGMWHQVAKEVDLQSTIDSVANEASTREAADSTLQANIDAEAATRAADDTTEANTRSGADAALSARLDTLEADPTTATAVAAGDTATLSSANSYTDTAVSNVIGAPLACSYLVKSLMPSTMTPTSTTLSAVQSDVDSNEADSDAAEAALSGRLDTLEADPPPPLQWLQSKPMSIKTSLTATLLMLLCLPASTFSKPTPPQQQLLLLCKATLIRTKPTQTPLLPGKPLPGQC